MRLFGRRKPSKIERAEANREVQVEIVAHKDATKKEVEKVKEANEALKETFKPNGFTLKIYLAAGGKLSAKGKH